MDHGQLTTKEAAKLAGIGVSTLNRKVSEKKFPQPIKIDRKNYYNKEEVQKWKKGNWFYRVIPDKIEQPVDAMFEDFNLYTEENVPWIKEFWNKHYQYILMFVGIVLVGLFL